MNGVPHVRAANTANEGSRADFQDMAARSCGNCSPEAEIVAIVKSGRANVRQRTADMASSAELRGGALGAEVRARRTQLQLRQEEVADLAGVSERFVYALENGKRTVQLDKVLAVLNVLGLHLQIQRGADTEIR